MRTSDFLLLTASAVGGQPARSFLTALGIAVGIASVVLLTAIGQGIEGFVLKEFTQFGTHLIAVTPGKTDTFGVSGAVFGNTRPLSLEDAESLSRLPGIEAMVPSVMGNDKVESKRRARRTNVLGVNHAVPAVWQMEVATGRFLPDDALNAPRPLAVIGARLKRELFADDNPLGQRLRVGGESFRVVGVMAPKGQFLGFDMDDAVYIPIGKALALFDREGLMEIDLLYSPHLTSTAVSRTLSATMIQRHGREDFTIVTQDQMLDVLGGILSILTAAVGGLGGISLLVGSVGIFTIMTIAVSERIREIGLLAALGATPGQISMLFLGEAALLAGLGGVAGVVLGVGGAGALAWLVPRIPVDFSPQVLLLAEGLAILTGIVAGFLPARRAGRENPVEALRAE